MIVSFKEPIWSRQFYLLKAIDACAIKTLCSYLEDLRVEFHKCDPIDEWTGEPTEWDCVTIREQTVEDLSEFEVKRLLLVLKTYGFYYKTNLDELANTKYLTVCIRRNDSDELEWDGK